MSETCAVRRVGSTFFYSNPFFLVGADHYTIVYHDIYSVTLLSIGVCSNRSSLYLFTLGQIFFSYIQTSSPSPLLSSPSHICTFTYSQLVAERDAVPFALAKMRVIPDFGPISQALCLVYCLKLVLAVQCCFIFLSLSIGHERAPSAGLSCWMLLRGACGCQSRGGSGF